MDFTLPSLKTKLLKALATTNTLPSPHPPHPPKKKGWDEGRGHSGTKSAGYRRG